MIFRQTTPILFSADIKRSIEYYIHVLGFENQWTWDDPATFGGVSKDLVEIFFCKDGQGHPGTWIYITVDNVDELYESIKAKDANIRAAPESMDWGMREMLVQDPDGHMIRFSQHVGRDREKSKELPDNIVIVERVPTVDEYQELVASVEWNLKPSAVVEMLLAASLYAVVAIDDKSGQVVGSVLVIGDHASFYYLKDMMVDHEWQGRKIGSALMQKVYEWLEANAIPGSLVGLYTGENLAPFYRQFGFRNSFGMTKRIGEKS